MPRQRTVGDPWYTALYRDPHTLWWAPGLIYFPITFVAVYLLGDSALEAALVSAILIAASTLGILVRRRLRRR